VEIILVLGLEMIKIHVPVGISPPPRHRKLSRSSAGSIDESAEFPLASSDYSPSTSVTSSGPPLGPPLASSYDDEEEEEYVGSPGNLPPEYYRKGRRGSMSSLPFAAGFIGFCFGLVGLAKLAQSGSSAEKSIIDLSNMKCEKYVLAIPSRLSSLLMYSPSFLDS